MPAKHFLSLCAIVKDEGPHLIEWVRHHLRLGVEHFYVYDNGSAIPAGKLLREYQDRDLVTVIDFPGRARQLEAYNHCLGTHGPDTTWLGVIDADEFILPRRHDDLRELLLDYDAQAGLALSCLVFGSCGHETRPAGRQIDSYRHRFPLEHGGNCLVKCLVQPARTTEAAGVHHFHFLPGSACVNPDGEPVFGPFAPVCPEVVRVNHYFFRSRQEYAAKLARGHADFPEGVMKYKLEAFDEQLAKAVVEDTEMADRFPDRGEKPRALEPGGDTPLAHAARLPARALLDRLPGCLESGDLDRAACLAKAAVIRDPASHETWLLHGICQGRLGRDAACLDALRASIRRRESIEAAFQIFGLLSRTGQADKARRAAAYLRHRLAQTPFVRDNAAYQAMDASLAAYLASHPDPETAAVPPFPPGPL